MKIGWYRFNGLRDIENQMELYHANKPQVWLGVIGDGGMLRIYNKAGKAQGIKMARPSKLTETTFLDNSAL